MKTTSEVIEALERLHITLSQMAPLAPSETDMNDNEHAAWMEQCQRIQGMVRDAHLIVEAALPPEIRRLLHQIRQAGSSLYAPTDTIPE